jgi:DNA excision repair protein ERCC-3
LQKLLKDHVIQECRLRRDLESEEVAEGQMTSKQGLQLTAANQKANAAEATDKPSDSENPVPSDIFDFYEKMDKEDDEETELKTVSVEISQDHLETLQKR